MYTFTDVRRRKPDAAPRGHRRRGARGHHQRPAARRAAQAVDRRARCSATSGRRRAATASSTRYRRRGASASPGPDIDIELIAMTARLWKQLGIARVHAEAQFAGHARVAPRLSREAGGLFHAACRGARRRQPAPPRAAIRCASSTARTRRCRRVISGAPLLTEHLDAESREHFDAVCATLAAMDIDYVVDPRLVRGLDYYSRTVFEWVTDALGCAERGLFRRPLRRPDRAAGRRGHAGRRVSPWAWSAWSS